MSQVLSQYFAREAGEYLSELDRLLRASDRPDAERIFRLARGVRGSAQVAQADGVAEVAARLEGAARFVLEGRIPWSDELRDRALRTVADLQRLVRVDGREWGDDEDARVNEALSRWGGFEDVVHTPTGIEPAAAVTSFVRAELAALVADLDDAVSALRSDAMDHRVLGSVVRRIRALRGVAGSESIVAAVEVLEGCDEMLRQALDAALPIRGERLELLDAAGSALQPVLTALDSDRRPAASSSELDRFRVLRSRLAGIETDLDDEMIVPIHTLLFDDQGPTVVSSPVAPVAFDGADRDVESFLRGEAASVLDSAEGLLAGADMHPATDTSAVLRRVSEIVGSLSELAETYRRTDVASIASSAQAELRAIGSTADARVALGALRGRLAEPGRVAFAADSPAPGTPPVVRPPDLDAGPAADADVVPIEELLLTGGAALEAALRLRPGIEARVAAGTDGRAELETLLSELWDLIDLGRRGESVR